MLGKAAMPFFGVANWCFEAVSDYQAPLANACGVLSTDHTPALLGVRRTLLPLRCLGLHDKGV